MSQEFCGRLRQRVQIERASISRDDSANIVESWVRVADVWAGLVPVEGATQVMGEGRVSRRRFRVTLRAGAEIGSADRLRWGRLVLRILRIDSDPRAPEQVNFLVEETGQ